jgi:hypothetical protein
VKSVAIHSSGGRPAYAALALCLAPACLPQVNNPATTNALQVSCLPGERGYLRASLRGAIESELDWRGASIQCEGGARPDGRGIRVSFLGPADTGGRRLRLVFGVAATPGSARTAAAATNVTVIVEGAARVYTTRGDERCAVDAMVQEPLPQASPAGAASGSADAGRLYRVAARGYCIDPATLLDGSAPLFINRFDFAGVARFGDNDLHAALRN